MQESIDQPLEIGPLTQRGQRKHRTVEPEIEIFAKLPGLHQRDEVAMGGGDDPRYKQLREEWGDAFKSRLFWFLQIQALAALRYEYQRYADTYGATYVGLGVGAVQPLPPFAVPAVVREDHRLMLDLAATKELPHHITIGLGYSLLANFSNIANVLDNRTYTKHAVIASVGYTY